MPRYFFHLSAPGEFSPDDIGVEFPDVESAYLSACQAALDMSHEMLRNRVDPVRHSFEIADEKGHVLFELPFAEILRPANKSLPPEKLHASILQQRERALHANSELRAAVTRTRSLLRATRELLAEPLR